MKSGFRNTQWDPLLLIAQIIAVQSILYVSLGFIMAFMDIFVGANHTLDHLFQYHVSVCSYIWQRALWLCLIQCHNLFRINKPDQFVYVFLVCIFYLGNTCYWFRRAIRHIVFCAERFYWCFDITLHCWTYKTVFGFHMYLSFYAFVHLLGV